jgi:predicted acyl esterase
LRAPGHRLRLTVTSSDFPRWERNPNTGEPIGTSVALRVATNRVLHQPDCPSRVVLPVSPGELAC